MTSLLNQCQELHSQGKSRDEIVGFLRSQGCSKVQSIVVLKALGVDSSEAKKMVHFSNVWADMRERDTQFHESLHKVFEEDEI